LVTVIIKQIIYKALIVTTVISKYNSGISIVGLRAAKA